MNDPPGAVRPAWTTLQGQSGQHGRPSWGDQASVGDPPACSQASVDDLPRSVTPMGANPRVGRCCLAWGPVPCGFPWSSRTCRPSDARGGDQLQLLGVSASLAPSLLCGLRTAHPAVRSRSGFSCPPPGEEGATLPL